MLRVTFVSALLLLAALVLAAISQVRAHVHQGGHGKTMQYPRECCGQRDCHPVIRTERVGAGLWLHLADGTHHLIGPKDERRPSEDGDWHLCTRTDYEAQTKVVLCVFEPAIN